MAEIILTKDNFDSEVLNSDKTVLVDFWATWCGPCKMIAPEIEEISEEYKATVKVGKVNVDEQAELANKYRISSIPTLMIFKQGKLTDTVIGYRPKSDIEAIL